jgi:hypothetical protein
MPLASLISCATVFADVHDVNRRTIGGEFQCDGTANAAPSAREDRNFAIQPKFIYRAGTGVNRAISLGVAVTGDTPRFQENSC